MRISDWSSDVCSSDLFQLPYTHHILDPQQSGNWKGIGIHNLRTAGLWDSVDLHEESSEYCLPRLAQSGVILDMAFIDGWHTFDHTLIDFFYINRMLRVGGGVIFDDAQIGRASCRERVCTSV